MLALPTSVSCQECAGGRGGSALLKIERATAKTRGPLSRLFFTFTFHSFIHSFRPGNGPAPHTLGTSDVDILCIGTQYNNFSDRKSSFLLLFTPLRPPAFVFFFTTDRRLQSSWAPPFLCFTKTATDWQVTLQSQTWWVIHVVGIKKDFFFFFFFFFCTCAFILHWWRHGWIRWE